MNLRTLYAAGMGDALGMAPAELYDWERAVRDDGQFTGSRSGPGGGTPATPENVALLLLAILGSPTKRNAGRRATVISDGACYLRPGADRNSDHYMEDCPLTKQKSIGDALTVLLALPKNARDIERIEVDPDHGTVKIYQKFESDGNTYAPCHLFAIPRSETKEEPPISTVRVLSGDALRAIAVALSTGGE